jgi:hypothetical protein
MALALAGPAWAAGPGITVLAAATPAPPPGAPSAAIYLSLRNNGTQADRLLGLSTPVAGQAMVHSERIEGGVMRMQVEDALELLPGKTLAMHAGGTHVMLTDLKRSLVAGERFALLLRFARAGELRAEVTVLPLGSRP